MHEDHPCAPTCRKCGGIMKPGQVIPTAYAASDEGTISEAAYVGAVRLKDCLKCERCGRSVVGDPCALSGQGVMVSDSSPTP